MFEPTDEQLEKLFNPAYEDIRMIVSELKDETNCGNDYIIDFLKTITKSIEVEKEILDREGVDN